jgi:hypothetical protein
MLAALAVGMTWVADACTLAMATTAQPMDDEKTTCAVCEQPIVPTRDCIFRVDGRLEHLRCPAAARKPGARVTTEPRSTVW